VLVRLKKNEVIISVSRLREMLEGLVEYGNTIDREILEEDSPEVVEEEIQITIQETARRVQLLQEKP
jgi:hypothetical protein